MEVFSQLNYNPDLSIALGFFDGVHQGHQVVLDNCASYAKRHSIKSAVVTFKEHPKCFLLNRKPKYIIPQTKRLELIEKCGIDFAYVLDFNDSIAKLNAKNYLENLIVKNFEPRAITTGFNHFFGINRQGDTKILRENQKQYNYDFFEIPPITLNDVLISSSKIRLSIESCDFKIANSLLGYNFTVSGTVIKSKGLGRKISFPTANIIYPDDLIKFPFGVYVVDVFVKNNKYKGVLNYGNRPTFDDNLGEVLEVHILDFDEDIYNEEIKISPIVKIRDEKHFNSIYELKIAIESDINFLKINCN